MGNYRPITLIPILAKIFEKCMHKRIVDYCDKYQIIKSEQYGFQKHKSTSLAMFSLVKIILSNINNRQLTTGLFFDLSKAFDFVSHEILLQKLETVGIRGLVLQWLSSYLKDRQQCVIIDKIDKNNNLTSYSSEYKYNKFGVPQGSILGPILFLLYINDIVDITNHKCILYADDISIIVTCNKNNNTIRNHEDDINNTIDTLIEWLDINNLKINLDKSHYIQFNKSINSNHNIKINIPKLKEATCTKFLGVTLDEDINWKKQIDNVCIRINKFIYALKHVKNITNITTAIATYHAYVESILRYGLIIWGNGTDRNRAFVAQKKCIRAICGISPEESCKPLFKKLGILPLPSLYIYEVGVFVFKNKSLFVKASDKYPRNRRDPDKLVLDVIPRLVKYNKNCLNMCVKIYNKIPKEFKLLSEGLYKKHLYNWLKIECFYDLKDFL